VSFGCPSHGSTIPLHGKSGLHHGPEVIVANAYGLEALGGETGLASFAQKHSLSCTSACSSMSDWIV
ncbi:MAG: hypothetical protein OSA23_14715, partial [Rhodospirillales bacterium]|nr:hypothetical protein [Rhodospirillales bacterium]